MPDKIIETTNLGRRAWEAVASESGKPENTKQDPKVRDIWAGDCITREALSTMDVVIAKIGKMYTGVTSRQLDYKLSKTFNRIIKESLNKMEPLIISYDVSSFSSTEERKAWLSHHQYLYETVRNETQFNLIMS